jgi:hypothetical protein
MPTFTASAVTPSPIFVETGGIAPELVVVLAAVPVPPDEPVVGVDLLPLEPQAAAASASAATATPTRITPPCPVARRPMLPSFTTSLTPRSHEQPKPRAPQGVVPRASRRPAQAVLLAGAASLVVLDW